MKRFCQKKVSFFPLCPIMREAICNDSDFRPSSPKTPPPATIAFGCTEIAAKLNINIIYFPQSRKKRWLLV